LKVGLGIVDCLAHPVFVIFECVKLRERRVVSFRLDYLPHVLSKCCLLLLVCI